MTPTLSRKRRRKQYRQSLGRNWREVQDYCRFVCSMTRLCECDPTLRPCGGALAGGLCDRIQLHDQTDYDDLP